MKYSETEIAKALNMIKDICCDNDMKCEYCPFGKGSSCMFRIIDRIPEQWNIAEPPKEEVWRAFK